jgi:transcription elongation factor GreB
MSKAFTKEDDGDVPITAPRRRGVPVPVPNFLTASGLAAARAELEALARDGGDHDRARELADHLATAQVGAVDDRAIVGFGAAVTIEDDAGARTTYRIVGAIEADARRGLIGWQSALATALWGARVGDSVELPRGNEAVVAAIAYE